MDLLLFLAMLLNQPKAPAIDCPAPGVIETQIRACPPPPLPTIEVWRNGRWETEIDINKMSNATYAVGCFMQEKICVKRADGVALKPQIDLSLLPEKGK